MPIKNATIIRMYLPSHEQSCDWHQLRQVPRRKFTGTSRMKVFVRIIVKQHNANSWMAWLDGLPQVAFGGRWAAEAIQRLISMLGADQFVTDETTSIEEATKPGHLEFHVPLRRFRRIPSCR